MNEFTREMMIGKIHRATVTGADLHYVGSITVDGLLLDNANILEGQKVDIVNVTNGARLSTYTIRGDEGSGIVQLNGAAAHLVDPGDIVIIIAYAQVPDSLAHDFKQSVVLVDENNQQIHQGDNAGVIPTELANSTGGPKPLRSAGKQH